jgi:hypothetical protein
VRRTTCASAQGRFFPDLFPRVRTADLNNGDASATMPRQLAEHPQTVVAFAHFDGHICEPTRGALKAIPPHLTKDSVIGFDELNHPEFQGRTRAPKQVLGLDRTAIKRSLLGSYTPYPEAD